MSELPGLALAAVGGTALGAIFYEGLYRTVSRGIESKAPALWFSGSMVLRTALVLVAFHAISGGNTHRLIVCMPGFVLARIVVTRFRSAPRSKPLKAAHAR